MKKNVDLTAIAHDRTALLHRARELEAENAFLREALEHFLFCRACEVDEDFQYCELGKQYADKLGIITFANTKAVERRR